MRLLRRLSAPRKLLFIKITNLMLFIKADDPGSPPAVVTYANTLIQNNAKLCTKNTCDRTRRALNISSWWSLVGCASYSGPSVEPAESFLPSLASCYNRISTRFLTQMMNYIFYNNILKFHHFPQLCAYISNKFLICKKPE